MWLGYPNHPFPDSGELAVRIGVARCGANPCFSWEFCPLQIKTYNSRCTKIVVRFWIGCVAFATATVTAQAQTYTYYPVTSAPNVTTGTTTAPTYYYRKGWFGNRIVWSGYSAPVYQATNAPQYSQPANQAQPAQTLPTGVPVIPTSYTTANPTPAAAAPPATAPPAATTPSGGTGEHGSGRSVRLHRLAQCHPGLVRFASRRP